MEIKDAAGRNLFTEADEPFVGTKAFGERPAGPWDANGSQPEATPKNPCAWCQPETVGKAVSHGICQDCIDREFAKG